LASTAANLKEGEAELSSEETLRVLQEITNEQRLIFVPDAVIAVRAVELLGLRWLDVRHSGRRFQSAGAYGEGNS